MESAREQSQTETMLARLGFCAILFLLAPLSASAAESSLVWGGAPGGPEQITIQDEGTYTPPLNVEAPAYITAPDTGPNGEFLFDVFANLYRVTGPGEREFISTLYQHTEYDDPDDPDDGDIKFAWPAAGAYELDILSFPPPQVSFEDRLRRMIANVLFADIAHAQFFEPTLIETLHFTIEDVSASCVADCFSNVLFLPGLESSRLYRPNVIGPEIRVWEPSFFGLDHEQLLMNPDGTPVKTWIYTKDVIDEAFTANIYKSFIERMDELVADGTINEWNDFPYDWRFDINDVVDNPTALATSTISLIAEVERLAAGSKSGKVTIISHSNGGLVGKVLLSELESQGKADLVDKFIMVAVPQLGTPKTIATLLHGEAMPSQLFPFVAKAQEIREMAENMPSGYTLLPSTEYFSRVLDPVVEFVDNGSPLMQPLVDSYGLAITNTTELNDFLLGADGRSKPAESDVMNPNIMNSDLITQGAANHIVLDGWDVPDGIEVIQIVGWGVPTIRGIRYKEGRLTGAACSISNCSFIDHEPILTIDGDETVVVPSTSLLTIDTYYVNLLEYNRFKNLKINREHADIMEVDQLLSFMTNLIRNDTTVPSFIETSKPTFDPESAPALRISIHSPVSLDLYDTPGRHTGIATSTLSGNSFIEEQIPNSYYIEMGEGKYAGADILSTTTVRLHGLALGTFTLDIEQTLGDTITASTTFGNIPVTTSSTALLDIGDSTNLPVSKLSVDVDGDGVTDADISGGDGLTVPELLGLLRGLVQSLNLPLKKENKFIKAIDKLQKQILKNQNGKKFQKYRIIDALKDIKDKIKTFEKKKLLAKDEVKELLDILSRVQNLVLN